MGEKYLFEKPLTEAVIIKRNSQFTMDVAYQGEILRCHCPATTRIGDIDVKGVSCLISSSDDPKRKLRYTVEAVSCDEPEVENKNWIGINLILSNRLVEFLLETHQLDAMVSNYDSIRREVTLGISKLDFLVGNTYLEVKSPLTTLNVKYGTHIKTKKVTPFSSTDRFQKHIRELAGSLKSHERAILLTVNQYMPTEMRPHLRSTHYAEVSQTMKEALNAGIETWNINLKFMPDGAELISLTETSKETKNY
ncbi:MAG: DNA/RNA nuclease SfsA [Lachnospiraceae bacterium]|nr:DNA/RNA nuclease SfsA [Lachnospiraceae bacterium]